MPEDRTGGRVAVLHEQGLAGVEDVREAGKVLHDAETVDSRHYRTGDIAAFHSLAEALQRCLAVFGPDELNAGTIVFGVSLDRLDDVREERRGQKDGILLASAGDSHAHGLGRGCGTVVHGGVAHVHPGQGAYHALILEDVTERALGYLALIGSICREELRTREDIGDDGGRVVVVCPGSGEDLQPGITGGKRLEPVAHLLLGEGAGEVVLPPVNESGRYV